MKTTNNLKFSIICPVYHSENWISECIESVLGQTYGNFELIFVADDKSDPTLRIISSFSDKRIKFFVQSDNGPFLARDFGVQQSTGDFIMFIDADDQYEPRCLEKVLECINRYGVEFVSFGYYITDNNNSKIKTYCKNYNNYLVCNNDVFLESLYCKEIQMSLWNKAIKRECFLKYEYQNPEVYHLKHGEDYLYTLYFSPRIKKAIFIDDILYNYRQINSEALTVIQKNIQTLEEEIFNKYYEVFLFLKTKNINFSSFMHSRSYELYIFLLKMISSPSTRNKIMLEKVINSVFFTELIQFPNSKKEKLFFSIFKKKRYFVCKAFAILFKIKHRNIFANN